MSLEQKNTEKIMEGEHLSNNIIYYDDSLNCEKNYEIFRKILLELSFFAII